MKDEDRPKEVQEFISHMREKFLEELEGGHKYFMSPDALKVDVVIEKLSSSKVRLEIKLPSFKHTDEYEDIRHEIYPVVKGTPSVKNLIANGFRTNHITGYAGHKQRSDGFVSVSGAYSIYKDFRSMKAALKALSEICKEQGVSR